MRDFAAYSLSHCLVLSITIIALCLVLLFARKIKKGSPGDKAIRYIAVTIMLCLEVTFLVMSIPIESNKAYLLPLELCTISLYAMSFLLLSYNERVFKIVFFWAVLGSCLAILFPMLSSPFPTFRFWHYFLNHAIIFVMAHYMLLVERVEIKFKDFLFSWTIHLVVLLVIVLPVNFIFGTNFMFIMKRPAIFTTVFDWSGPVAPILWVLFIIALYHVFYLYLRLLSKLRNKMAKE